MFRKFVKIAVIITICLFAYRIAGGLAMFSLRLIPLAVAVFWLVWAFSRGKKRSSQEAANDTDRETRTNAAESASSEQNENVQSSAKEKSTSGTDPESALAADVRSITATVNGIRLSQIRSRGLLVVKVIKDIIREQFKEKNTCKGFTQFRNYYIPTLKTTLEKYRIMESKGVVTEKIQQDMISYLDSCETAFNRLYHSMFEDDLMNMEVQMESMNITLKRDGLL